MEEFHFKYFYIYTFFAIGAIFFALIIDFKHIQKNKIGVVLSVIFLLLLDLLFGLRTKNVGTDTDLYISMFHFPNEFEKDGELVNVLLIKFIRLFTNNPQYYLLSLSSIFLFTTYFSFLKEVKINNTNIYLLVFSFFSLFFFKYLGINIVRQGVALSFIILAYKFFEEDKKRVVYWLLPIILAVGFHTSSLVIVIIFILILILKKIRIEYYYLLFFLFIILAFFDIGVLIFGKDLELFLGENRRASYLNGKMENLYEIGFKPQFVAFSSLFLLISIWIRKFIDVDLEKYDLQIKLYICLNCVFFMMFQIPFSDRWGIMAWLFIPFLLSPMFVVKERPKTAFVTVLLLIMIFITFNVYNSAK